MPGARITVPHHWLPWALEDCPWQCQCIFRPSVSGTKPSERQGCALGSWLGAMLSSFLRKCRTPSSAAAKMFVQPLLSPRLPPTGAGERSLLASWRGLGCVPGRFGESKQAGLSPGGTLHGADACLLRSLTLRAKMICPGTTSDEGGRARSSRTGAWEAEWVPDCSQKRPSLKDAVRGGAGQSHRKPPHNDPGDELSRSTLNTDLPNICLGH